MTRRLATVLRTSAIALASCMASSAAAGAPSPPVDLQLVEEALEARLHAADHLIAVSGGFSWSRSKVIARTTGPTRITDVRPQAPTSESPARFSLDGAGSVLCWQKDEEYYVQTWQATGRTLGHWHDVLRFVHQDAVHRAITLMILQPPAPLIEVVLRAPVDDERTFLFALGLAHRDGTSLLNLLKGQPQIARTEPLRGVQCLVVEGATGEAWLAPDLNYAPLRLVRRDEENSRAFADDWWGYRVNGDLALPGFHLARRVGGEGDAAVVETLSLGRVSVAAAGADEVSRLIPPDWGVPTVAGALVDREGQDAAPLGYSPYALWRIAEADGKAWGLSVAALAADTEFKLPDTPETGVLEEAPEPQP